MASNAWNPDRYLKGAMGDLRTRPALDLLARIPLEDARTVYDLGCGPGNSTAPLKARWPEARVVGVDNSEAMLARARANHPGLEFEHGDIAGWMPDEPADVIFANASIHWVHDHEGLFRRLLAALRPGGCVAVQQPCNFEAPSHMLIREIAAQEPYRAQVLNRLVGDFVQAPAFYHGLLRADCDHVDVWETIYQQALTGVDPVFEWVRGTALLPMERHLDALDFDDFVKLYRKRLREAYPMAADGITLFPFRRMFIIGRLAENGI